MFSGVTVVPVTEEAPSTQEDYDSLHAAVAEMERRGWRKTTLNERVEGWESLVAEVEQGYGMTVDDYTNDLAVREWLDLVRPILTMRLRDSLDERLSLLDERFRAATVKPAVQMPGAGDAWFYRLPKALVGELAEDAARMRLSPQHDA
jgi:hypothetical protein